MCIMMGYGGVFESKFVYRDAAITLTIEKAQQPQWQMILLRGIGANWLVCFAVFISISARDIASKIIA
ncbi:formate/nitrite transporter family protein, partial [Klebsiella pneumoniae]|nr:formate/nitrite transporter family protein [Klebsiella pneumoniae]